MEYHSMCMFLRHFSLPAVAAWPSLFSRFGQQVLSLCILAQLSFSGHQPRAYVRHRQRKRTWWNTPALHHEMLPNARNIDNQAPWQSSGSRWGAVNMDTWLLRESEKSLRGSGLHSCLSFSFKKACLCVFAQNAAAVLGKHVLNTC